MSDTKFAVTSYNGSTIRCSKSIWNSHIVVGHKNMADNELAVKDTIKNPDAVYESSQNDDREVYFKMSEFSTYNITTKVVVEYSQSKKNPDILVGEVVTAFPVKGEKGGIGNVVYRKSTN